MDVFFTDLDEYSRSSDLEEVSDTDKSDQNIDQNFLDRFINTILPETEETKFSSSHQLIEKDIVPSLISRESNPSPAPNTVPDFRLKSTTRRPKILNTLPPDTSKHLAEVPNQVKNGFVDDSLLLDNVLDSFLETVIPKQFNDDLDLFLDSVLNISPAVL